jgi:hypothetical protein
MLTVVLALALTPLGLDNKRTAINGVDDGVSTGEGEVRPCTSVPESVTATGLRIITGVDVEVGNFLDLGAVGELGDGADVEDAETGLVVGLEGKTVVDELVVVDHAGGGLVVAGDLGGFEVLDVPDVRDCETVLGGGSDSSAVGVDLALVELVIHDEMGLPVLVGDPALVSVRGAGVGSAGNDGTSADTLLVGDVVDGQGVLVVTVADITSVVLLVRTTVHDALSVVSVAILGCATLNVRLGDVISVDENGSTSTGVVATGTSTAAKSDGVVLLLVCADSVRASRNTLGEVDPGNVSLDVEGLGALGRELEELLHVEKLDTVANTLGSDDKSVLQDLHLAPDNGIILGGETAEVLEFTLLGDLSKCSTVRLTDGNEFAVLVRPAPRARAFANGVTELSMCLEVVHVLKNVSIKSLAVNSHQTHNVLALVRLVGIALDSLNTTVLALDLVLVDAVLVEAVPSLAIVFASFTLLGP